MIDSMLAHDIKPYATIFHWDLPQVSPLPGPAAQPSAAQHSTAQAVLHRCSVEAALRLLLRLCVPVLVCLCGCVQVLQDKYSGFVSPQIIEDYVNYADVLFANFGNRVKDWMTFNEPWITCTLQVQRSWH